jgi:hypothetical protein
MIAGIAGAIAGNAARSGTTEVITDADTGRTAIVTATTTTDTAAATDAA